MVRIPNYKESKEFFMCAHEESNLNYGIRNPVSYPLNDGRACEKTRALNPYCYTRSLVWGQTFCPLSKTEKIVRDYP